MAVTVTPVGAATVVVAVALSLPGLGSGVGDETVAVLERTVPPGTDEPTATVKVKTAPLPRKLPAEQLTVPPAPTAGVVHDQPPAGAARRTWCPPAACRSGSHSPRCSDPRCRP